MTKTFALAASLLALLLPLASVSAQDLGAQVATTRTIETLHVVAVGMEVDSDLIPVARDRIVIGKIKAGDQEHRVGILVRDTGEDSVRYKIRDVTVDTDAEVAKGNIYDGEQLVGSFEFTAIHRGDATFWKGPVTINDVTTTFIGKSIPRLHSATERSRMIAMERSSGEQGTDLQLEIRHHVREANDDERSREFLRVRCREEGAQAACKAELEGLTERMLAKRLEMLSDQDLERLRIRDDLVVKARTHLNERHRLRIDALRVATPEAFEAEQEIEAE